MELNVEQIIDPLTLPVTDEIQFDEKHSLDVFKTENEKVLKQKVNDEWILKITEELYEECDQLIGQKINLINDLKIENEHIIKEMQNKSEMQLKLDGDKKNLQSNFIKCKEHFKRLKNIQEYFKSTNEELRKKIKEIQDDIYNYKQKEKDDTEKYSTDINNSIQLIESENMCYIRMLQKIKINFEQMDIQQLDLKDQTQKLQESLNEMEKKQQLSVQEQKAMVADVDDLLNEFTKLKEKKEAYVKKYESEKLERDNRITELKINLHKDEESIAILKIEHENLKEYFDGENIRMDEVQKKHSSLDSALNEAEEMLVSIQKEQNECLRQLQQQRETFQDQLSSKLDNVNVLKDDYKLLYDKNINLKQSCADNEGIIATLKNRIQELLDNKASTDNNLLHNIQKIQENEKSYADIINEYMKIANEIRGENVELLNTHENLNSEVESREQEYDEYKNDMDAILNQYCESEENSKKCIEELILKTDGLKGIIQALDEEIKNKELEAEENCKLIEEDSEKMIEKISKDFERMKHDANDVASNENYKYLEQKKQLNEATKNKNIQIRQLKVTKTELQKELDKYMGEISRLSAECELNEMRKIEICDSKQSTTIEIRDIEKNNKPDLPKLSTMTPNERIQLLSESSDDAFHYNPRRMDVDSQWKKLKVNESAVKMLYPTKPKLTYGKSASKYEMSFKDTDSDVSESSRDKSDDLFVPIRATSPMFKQPLIRRPARTSQKSKMRKPVY